MFGRLLGVFELLQGLFALAAPIKTLQICDMSHFAFAMAACDMWPHKFVTCHV